MSKPAEVITIAVGASLKDVERRVIVATLRHARGNISATAKILRIDRCTLYSKIEKYKIKR